MQIRDIVPVAAGLLLCALMAGCTSPTGTEFPTPATTPGPPPSPTTWPTIVPTPLPVETLPPEQAVELVLSKQRPDSSIHLVYNGGKGEVFVQSVLMKVTFPNGTVYQQYMNDGNRKPRRGDELVVEGTRGTDIVQV